MDYLEDKESKAPVSVSVTSSQNVDSVDYFGSLSDDEKQEVASGLHLATQNKDISDLATNINENYN